MTRRAKWCLAIVVLLSSPFCALEATYQVLAANLESVPDHPSWLLDDRAAIVVWVAEGQIAGDFEAMVLPIEWALVRDLWRNIRGTRIGRRPWATMTARVVAMEWEPRRSPRRTLDEAATAKWIERHFTQREAITYYAEHAYFGPDIRGLHDMARLVFDREVEELQLAQLVLLASLPYAPSKFSPWRHPERARERRNYVLGRLYDSGRFDPEEVLAAIEEPLGIGRNMCRGRLTCSECDRAFED